MSASSVAYSMGAGAMPLGSGESSPFLETNLASLEVPELTRRRVLESVLGGGQSTWKRRRPSVTTSPAFGA